MRERPARLPGFPGMAMTKISAALAPALLLLGCGQSQAPGEQAEPAPPATANAAATPDAMPATGPGRAQDVSPAEAAPHLAAEAERGIEGARNVLLGFARAIERKDFGVAWALLSPADREKWSRSTFAAMFADLDGITVAIPDGTTEGAAGSLYYTAPVTITASDKDRRPVRMEGSAVLRRVNNVDGAAPEQLRWHFATLTLDWTH